jgi:hypothetical protein
VIILSFFRAFMLSSHIASLNKQLRTPYLAN